MAPQPAQTASAKSEPVYSQHAPLEAMLGRWVRNLRLIMGQWGHAIKSTVSVVIPCYKQAKFLHFAVESVLAQTVAAAEIIVVDDGSPDHPELVCECFPGVRYHRQPNMGVSMARNKGLSLAPGSHVIFLDADDMLLPHAIERQLQAFEDDPGLGMVFGWYETMDDQCRPLGTETARHVGDFDYESMLRRNLIGGPATVMIRRDVLEAIGGFDPTVSPTEDYEIFLRVSRSYPVRGLDCQLARYRIHTANASGNKLRMLRQVLRVFARQRLWVSGHPGLERAFSEGRTFYQAFYGESIFWGSLRSARDRDFPGAGRAGMPCCERPARSCRLPV